MNKIIKIIVIIIAFCLFSTNSLAEITKQEAEEYLGKNVLIILDDFVRPYAVYGRVTDIIYFEGEYYILLHIYYRQKEELFLKLSTINTIRERYENE